MQLPQLAALPALDHSSQKVLISSSKVTPQGTQGTSPPKCCEHLNDNHGQEVEMFTSPFGNMWNICGTYVEHMVVTCYDPGETRIGWNRIKRFLSRRGKTSNLALASSRMVLLKGSKVSHQLGLLKLQLLPLRIKKIVQPLSGARI